MHWRSHLILLCMLGWSHWCNGEFPEFLEYPPNTTYAPLGSTVTLVCVADQPVFAWQVNNVQFLHGTVSNDVKEQFGLVVGPTEEVDRGYNRSTLSFDASVDTNNSFNTILCQAGQTQLTVEDGQLVYITVYGLPLAPVEVEVTRDRAHQLRLNWGPPFTFPGETISYSVFIKDLVTGQNETVVGLTDTVYTHSVSEAQALTCHTFYFSVSSVNAVGHSINSSSAEAVHPSAPGTIVITSTKVSFTEQLSISLSLKVMSTCFPLSLSVLLEVDETQPATVCTGPHTEIAGDKYIPLTAAECGVRDNIKYMITVRAENKFNLTSSSDETNIYTTDVQLASAEELDNTSLLFKCMFAEGSSARGCQLTLQLSHTGNVKVVVELHRKDRSPWTVESYDIGVVWGEYPTLVARDIEADGNIADSDGIPGTIELKASSSTTMTVVTQHEDNKEMTNEGEDVVVIVPVVIVTALLLVSVIVALISIICYRQRKSSRNEVVLRPRAVAPVYEEVDSMIFNPQYINRKLQKTRTHTPSSTLPPDSLQQGDGCSTSDSAGIFTEHGNPHAAKAGKTPSCLDTEIYEVMKSGVSVKEHAKTAENCYSKITTHL